MIMRHRKKSAVAIYVSLVVLVVIWFTPIIWLIMTSFRTLGDTLSWPPVIIFRPIIDHYKTVLFESNFIIALSNSIIVGFMSTLLVLVLAVPAAYVITRYKFPNVEFYIISTKMTPPIVVLFAAYIMFFKVGLLGTRLSLVILHTALNLPLAVWLLKGFFQNIPIEIEEAAKVDGCNQFRVIVRIVLPLSVTALGITGILCFMFSWTEFLFASTLLGGQTLTVPVMVFRWLSYTQIEWGALSATGILYVIPMLFLTLIIRKHVTRGISFGLLK
jgi:multiple sugar transport system permease protein